MIKIYAPSEEVVGKQAFIDRNEPELSEACKMYGRNPDSCAIKVFYGNPLGEGEKLTDALWGDNPDLSNPHDVRKNTKLFDGSKIQNILWWHGLAPRVYGIFEAEYEGNRVACQLVEYITGDRAKDDEEIYHVYGRVKEFGKNYHFSDVKNILNRNDVISGKIVDVQQFAFDRDAINVFKNIYIEKGRYGKVYYQDIPELDLWGGPRKSEDRIKYLSLDKVDLKGKVVWDVGCAGGYFLRWARLNGATRAIGFDNADTIYSAFMIGTWLGFFNIDYVECDLRRGIKDDTVPKADVALFLSMNFHVPIHKQILEAPVVVFEDNGKETRHNDVLGEPWISNFNNIEFVGRGEDHGNKAIYHLHK